MHSNCPRSKQHVFTFLLCTFVNFLKLDVVIFHSMYFSSCFMYLFSILALMFLFLRPFGISMCLCSMINKLNLTYKMLCIPSHTQKTSLLQTSFYTRCLYMCHKTLLAYCSVYVLRAQKRKYQNVQSSSKVGVSYSDVIRASVGNGPHWNTAIARFEWIQAKRIGRRFARRPTLRFR